MMTDLFARVRAWLTGKRRWLLGALALVVVVAAVGAGLRFTALAGNGRQPSQTLLYYSTGDSVQAIRASNGQLVWRDAIYYASVFAGAGAVLAVRQSQVALLDGQTGHARWYRALDYHEHVDAHQPLFTADTVYVVLSLGGETQPHAIVLALSLADGHLRWQYAADRVNNLYLLLANNLLLVGERAFFINPIHNLTLAALDAGSGRMRWTYTQRTENLYPVGVQGTTLLIHSGMAAALNLATGTLLWHAPVYGINTVECLGAGVVYTSVYATPDAQPTPTNLSAEAGIAAYRLSDGAQLWRRDLLPYRFTVPLACTGGTVLVSELDTGNQQMFLYDIDARTGIIRWQKPPMVAYYADPLSSGGAALLYPYYASGTPMALDAATLAITTNTVRWHIHLATITNVSVIPLFAAGMVYLTVSGPNTATRVYALDAATGALRWQRTIGNYFDTLHAEPSV
jgi:outer membrane protein assembly factor BamB